MAENSKIEWTDASWNPIRARNLKTGKLGWHCEHATTGCEFCYAESINKRLGTGLPFKPGHRADIEIFIDEHMLLAPLRWKRPRKIFPGSMTDLFADFVTDAQLDKIFAVMALCQQHMFQVLTKRAERMREYFDRDDHDYAIGAALGNMLDGPWIWNEGKKFRPAIDALIDAAHGEAEEGEYPVELLPLPNVWLGVSAERQQEADERIPLLLQTPAAVRFVSAEPLLGPIDLTRIRHQLAGESFKIDNALYAADFLNKGSEQTRLDWVIVGGESGGHARAMHPDWARSLRDQCQAAGVPFFFKQWGAWRPSGQFPEYATHGLFPNGTLLRSGDLMCGKARGPEGQKWYPIRRVGKKAAGRHLDGCEHNEYPR